MILQVAQGFYGFCWNMSLMMVAWQKRTSLFKGLKQWWVSSHLFSSDVFTWDRNIATSSNIFVNPCCKYQNRLPISTIWLVSTQDFFQLYSRCSRFPQHTKGEFRPLAARQVIHESVPDECPKRKNRSLLLRDCGCKALGGSSHLVSS